MPLSRITPDSGGLRFEDAFSELQRLVEQLETGGLDLERTITLFEDGSRLARACEQLLEGAELRVTRLTAEPASSLPDEPASI